MELSKLSDTATVVAANAAGATIGIQARARMTDRAAFTQVRRRPLVSPLRNTVAPPSHHVNVEDHPVLLVPGGLPSVDVIDLRN